MDKTTVRNLSFRHDQGFVYVCVWHEDDGDLRRQDVGDLRRHYAHFHVTAMALTVDYASQ